MNQFIKLIIALSLLSSAAVIAGDKSGFYFGAGYVATVDDTYFDEDTTGWAIEGGYELNRNIAFDVKLSETTYDNYDSNLSMKYLGVNAGTDFGSRVFKLYGKIGYADAAVSDGGGSDSNVALGAGVRFALDGDQQGFFLKAEALRAEFLGSYTTVMYAGFGFMF